MSRQPTVLDTFSMLDDHWNSNLVGVDVNAQRAGIGHKPKSRIDLKFGCKLV